MKKDKGDKDVVEEEGKDGGDGGHQVELEVKVLENKEAMMVSSKSRNNEHLKQPTLLKSFLKWMGHIEKLCTNRSGGNFRSSSNVNAQKPRIEPNEGELSKDEEQ